MWYWGPSEIVSFRLDGAGRGEHDVGHEHEILIARRDIELSDFVETAGDFRALEELAFLDGKHSSKLGIAESVIAYESDGSKAKPRAFGDFRPHRNRFGDGQRVARLEGHILNIYLRKSLIGECIPNRFTDDFTLFVKTDTLNPARDR